MVSTTSDRRPFLPASLDRNARAADDAGMARLDYLLIALAVVILAALAYWTLELGAILSAPVS